MPQNNPTSYPQEETDLRDHLQHYLLRWPLFVYGVIFCVLAAVLYLRYTSPVYHTVSTVILKSDKKAGMPFDMPDLAGMGDILGGMGNSSITNELGILGSKRLMTTVVKELNLNVRYFQEGTVRTTELYSNRPFKVQLLAFDEELYTSLDEPEPLFFTVHNDSTYTVEMPESGFVKKMTFGESLTLPYAEVSVTPNLENLTHNSTISNEGPIRVSFRTIEDAALDYRGKIDIQPTEKNGTLVELSLQDPLKDKAQHILNELIKQYNKDAIEDKNLVSLNTAGFIEERLQIITRELDSVETGKEQFKKENQLTDITAESQLFIQDVSEFKNRQLEVETQLELANMMIDYLQTKERNELLPSNLGFKEEGVVNIIQSYNELVLERDHILAGSTERNPVVLNLNNQIEKIRDNVLQSLSNLKLSLEIVKNDLNVQEARMDVQIAEVPSMEKEFRNIERQQNIKEALYLFLLQKREETSLSLAVTTPKAKIVDEAYSSKKPVAPRSTIVIMAGFVLGIFLPFLYLYVKKMLNNKITSREDIENITRNIPVIGDIPKIKGKEKELVGRNDRSVLAESFRILHTNIQYLLSAIDNTPSGNTVFVTSSVKGEGKTFVAFNLALTLANSGNSVLLVGADLRNPQLHRYEPLSVNKKGISDYLSQKDLIIKDLITTSDIEDNLKLLPAGNIPPNPSDIWRNKKTASLFEELQQNYDFVVVDTAPSMMVTDTFLIKQYADLTLYIARAGYTEKKLVNFAENIQKEGKLKQLNFVLNAVDSANYGYGTRYGSYGEEKLGFWKKLKNKAAFW